ncbi:MAG: signal peptidase I [Gammaproteobacteria bacterium]|nr:signal peptidase I [Gammaproteobacteria bacterium]MDH5653276.1 signal peptidase I [Gammaproteobacteria bacterium]
MTEVSRIKTYWLEWRSFLVFVLLLVLFRSAIADWYVVPTGSMKPNILEGDRIFVNKLAYDLRLPFTDIALANWDQPQHGDIVVFFSPRDETRLIKRVIGLPGDIIVIQDNQLYINGKAVNIGPSDLNLEENIWHSGVHRQLFAEKLGTHNYPVAVSPRAFLVNNFGPVKVPADHYFMLGDNRDNSADSRMIGFVERSRIVGRASHVIVSLNYSNYYLPRKNRTFVALP